MTHFIWLFTLKNISRDVVDDCVISSRCYSCSTAVKTSRIVRAMNSVRLRALFTVNPSSNAIIEIIIQTPPAGISKKSEKEEGHCPHIVLTFWSEQVRFNKLSQNNMIKLIVLAILPYFAFDLARCQQVKTIQIRMPGVTPQKVWFTLLIN